MSEGVTTNIFLSLQAASFGRNEMDISLIRLQKIARQLPPQQLRAVIDFAEFLSFKIKKENLPITKKPLRSKQLDLPVIRDVKFIGDPLLRREDMYDASRQPS